MPARRRLVLKLGGELLEQPADLRRIADGIARLSKRAALVVVPISETISLKITPLNSYIGSTR